jgi:hypothetical protein
MIALDTSVCGHHDAQHDHVKTKAPSKPAAITPPLTASVPPPPRSLALFFSGLGNVWVMVNKIYEDFRLHPLAP